MKDTRFCLFLGTLVGLLSACEISVFGSDPINVFGANPPTSGDSARACEEPEDGRRAREGTCAERCRLDIAEGTTDCETLRLNEVRQGVATLDMGTADGVVITFRICDPEGIALHLSDSSTADADGGDAQTSSHDASVILEGTTLIVHASEGSGVEASSVESYVAATGCTERTLVLSEQLVYLADQNAGLCGPGMLRIDPPTDAEGTPDSLWYLSFAGTVDGERSGSGLREATFCFW